MTRRRLKLVLFLSVGAILLLGALLRAPVMRGIQAIVEPYIARSNAKLDFLYRDETALMAAAIRAYFETGAFTPNFGAEELEAKSGWGQLSFAARNSNTKRPPPVSTTGSAQPSNAIMVARRLGDYVFSCHGSDPAATQSDLWVVMLCFDPRVNKMAWPTGTVTVGLGDGIVRQFPVTSLSAELTAQNQIRSGYGLPPLPDPRIVLDVATSNEKRR